MNDILLKLAERVRPTEIISFLLIVSLTGVIVYLIQALKRKDKIFIELLEKFYMEIMEHGNSLTRLVAIIDFMAYSRRKSDDLGEIQNDAGAEPKTTNRATTSKRKKG